MLTGEQARIASQGKLHYLELHVVPKDFVPSTSFESIDYGSSNPTCWLIWAVDYDGNLVVYDEFYEPDLLENET